MKKLKMDWERMFCLKNEKIPSKLKELLTEYDVKFNGGMSCLKEFKMNIPTDKEAKAKFCWVRPVPYALTEGVEKESDRLESQGIYQRVEYSKRAEPIVPVVKSHNGGDPDMWRLQINDQYHRSLYWLFYFSNWKHIRHTERRSKIPQTRFEPRLSGIR